MSQLAMRTVGLALAIEQGEDLGSFGVEQLVHRRPARCLSANCPRKRRVIQRCARTSPSPSSWQARRSVQPASTASSSTPGSAVLVAASTRCGTRPLSPKPLPLNQRQPCGHLFERLGQPRVLRIRRLQLVVALTRGRTGFGRRQRRQRALLGHRADAHDRRRPSGARSPGFVVRVSPSSRRWARSPRLAVTTCRLAPTRSSPIPEP